MDPSFPLPVLSSRNKVPTFAPKQEITHYSQRKHKVPGGYLFSVKWEIPIPMKQTFTSPYPEVRPIFPFSTIMSEKLLIIGIILENQNQSLNYNNNNGLRQAGFIPGL